MPSPTMTTRELLAEYANLINRFGVDSAEADRFLGQHKDNQEFVELADTSKLLKKALTAPMQNGTERAGNGSR